MEKKTQEARARFLSLSLIRTHEEEREKRNAKSRTHIIACIAAFGAAVSTAGVASFISKAFSADWTASATEVTFSSSSTLPSSFGSTTARIIEKEVALLLDEVAQDDDAARAQREVCCKENIYYVCVWCVGADCAF